jgi:hypothetical protein
VNNREASFRPEANELQTRSVKRESPEAVRALDSKPNDHHVMVLLSVVLLLAMPAAITIKITNRKRKTTT